MLLGAIFDLKFFPLGRNNFLFINFYKIAAADFDEAVLIKR